MARLKEVNRDAERGSRLGYTTKNEQRRLEREVNRQKALASWETLNSHVMVATASTVLANLPPVGDFRVVNWMQGTEAGPQMPPAEPEVSVLGEGRDVPTLLGAAGMAD